MGYQSDLLIKNARPRKYILRVKKIHFSFTRLIDIFVDSCKDVETAFEKLTKFHLILLSFF